jgi:hypothetical protein
MFSIKQIFSPGTDNEIVTADIRMRLNFIRNQQSNGYLVIFEIQALLQTHLLTKLAHG